MNFFPTKKRQWPGFCERKLEIAGEKVPEYYARMAVCNLLHTQIDLPLDAELVLTGENEVSAAKRLIARLCNQYPRLFDVVVADALYMEGPFINSCLKEGKDVIVVLKDNYPSLLEDARGLFSRMQPQIWHVEDKTIHLWDVDGFVTDTIDVPLRVLHAAETHIEKIVKDGQRIEREVTKHWWWATTIPQKRLTTQHLWKLGHSRWQIENNIFNILGQHWSLDHCYKHDPVAMVNFVLMLFIAFTLIQCFYKRNLKTPMRKVINSLIALANQFYAALGIGVDKAVIRQSGSDPP